MCPCLVVSFKVFGCQKVVAGYGGGGKIFVPRLCLALASSSLAIRSVCRREIVKKFFDRFLAVCALCVHIILDNARPLFFA